MPINKNAFTRYKVIDATLRRNKYVKTSRLIEIFRDHYDLIVGATTINKDIRDMMIDGRLGFDAPIKYSHSEKAYYYPENVEEIFPVLDLVKEEINALLFYAKTISQYKDYPIFDKISNAVKKVIDNSNIPQKTKELFEKETLLETEIHLPTKGIELIINILEAIAQRNVIEIEYKKFEDIDSKIHKIKPILLKEDKQMWYIIGINIKYNSLITFALDRIINIVVTDEQFEYIKFDSEEYFKYSFGVTVYDDDPIDVIISIDPKQGHYLKTLPIHHSQKILKENSKEFLISLKVKPTYEFYKTIKSYGEQATIISPSFVRKEMLDSINKAVKNYKSKK